MTSCRPIAAKLTITIITVEVSIHFLIFHLGANTWITTNKSLPYDMDFFGNLPPKGN